MLHSRQYFIRDVCFHYLLSTVATPIYGNPARWWWAQSIANSSLATVAASAESDFRNLTGNAAAPYANFSCSSRPDYVICANDTRCWLDRDGVGSAAVAARMTLTAVNNVRMCAVNNVRVCVP